MFYFYCPKCAAKLQCEDDMAGVESVCPKCAAPIRLDPPEAEPASILQSREIDTEKKPGKKKKQDEEIYRQPLLTWIICACGFLWILAPSLYAAKKIIYREDIVVPEIMGIFSCVMIGALHYSVARIISSICETAYYTRKLYELEKDRLTKNVTR